MTTESSENGAITQSCMNFSGYVGHVTIVSQMLTTAFTSTCCVLVGLGLGLGLDLVSGWLVVLHTYSYYRCTFRCRCHSP